MKKLIYAIENNIVKICTIFENYEDLEILKEYGRKNKSIQ